MRRAFFLAAMIFAQPASAGDQPYEPAARPKGAWAGAYGGIFGGAGIGSGHATLGDYVGTLIPADVGHGLFPRAIAGSQAGASAGVSAGVNFQSGFFVGGIEGDLGHAGASTHLSYSRIDTVPGSPFPGVSTDTKYDTDFGAVSTLRLRGGFAFGKTLLFASAGVAAAEVSNRFELSLREIGYTSPDWSASGIRFGYTVGVGIEQRLTDTVSLKLETLYMDLADSVVHGADPAAFPGESIDYRFANAVLIPRLAVNVKF